MSVPGVGPLTALAYATTVDNPRRFKRSTDVGAYLGLTPRRYQSGAVDRVGRVSKCGDRLTRSLLYEATGTLLFHNKTPRQCARGAYKSWPALAAKRRVWLWLENSRSSCIGCGRKTVTSSQLGQSRRNQPKPSAPLVLGSPAGTSPGSSRDSLHGRRSAGPCESHREFHAISGNMLRLD